MPDKFDGIFFLYNLTLCAWLCALFLLSLKLVNSKIDAITSYGKLAPTITKMREFTPTSPNFVPLRVLFTSIYLVASIWNALLFVFVIAFSLTQSWSIREWIRVWREDPLSCLTIACPVHYVISCVLYEIHVVRRLAECLWVHRFSPHRTSLLNFVLAHSYYVFAPLALAMEGITRICRKNHTIMRNEFLEKTSSGWHTFRLLVGLVMFLYASWLQHSAHKILSALRKKNNTKYKIPQSGAFKLLIAPHYTAEIIIYLSLTLLLGTWNSLWTLVTLFVFINLTHAAHKTRQWYSRTFPHSVVWTQTKRFLLIPYIY